MPVPYRMIPRLALCAAVATAALAVTGCQSRSPSGEGVQVSAKPPVDQDLPLRMKPDEVRDYLGGHSEALLLDVRDTSEWNDDLGHITGSKSIPLSQLGGRLQEIEDWKDLPIVVISRVGDRGGAAVIVLREAGFNEVTGLEGGLEAWRKAGF